MTQHDVVKKNVDRASGIASSAVDRASGIASSAKTYTKGVATSAKTYTVGVVQGAQTYTAKVREGVSEATRGVLNKGRTVAGELSAERRGQYVGWMMERIKTPVGAVGAVGMFLARRSQLGVRHGPFQALLSRLALVQARGGRTFRRENARSAFRSSTLCPPAGPLPLRAGAAAAGGPKAGRGHRHRRAQGSQVDLCREPRRHAELGTRPRAAARPEATRAPRPACLTRAARSSADVRSQVA